VESRADRRTSHALHTVTTHDHASDRPGYFIGELRFNGTAPIPVWSGNKVRVRLSRGGNRRINTALHMAAVTQLRLGGEGTDYYDKLIAAGKTRTEALRLLRRRISDRVFAAMRA
jgi:transposase